MKNLIPVCGINTDLQLTELPLKNISTWSFELHCTTHAWSTTPIPDDTLTENNFSYAGMSDVAENTPLMNIRSPIVYPAYSVSVPFEFTYVASPIGFFRILAFRLANKWYNF